MYWRACGCRKFSEGRPHLCEPSWPLDEPADEKNAGEVWVKESD